MLILWAIFIGLITPLAVWGLSFSRLSRGYLWLISILSSLVAWGLVLSIRPQVPLSRTLIDWQPEFIFAFSPAILVDDISWPFAVAVITMPLVILLTDITQEAGLNPHNWASIQALGGVGLLAVVAGNPLTLLMAWAVIDIVESAVLLLRLSSSQDRERVVVAFSVRVAGMFFLIIARSYGVDHRDRALNGRLLASCRATNPPRELPIKAPLFPNAL